MNRQKLKMAEAQFLAHYPGGFGHPDMVTIGKKHRMDKMVAMVTDCFTEAAFDNVELAASNMVKVVSRSSMVSMFEKPKFRDFVNRLNRGDREYLVLSLRELLHGDQPSGFTRLVDILRTEKLAKWSLLTIIPAYYAPTVEVFVKPTTAKGIIRHFEVEDLIYRPTPSWEFYRGYRQLINSAKLQVAPSLSPSNAAFSGFLMMVMQG